MSRLLIAAAAIAVLGYLAYRTIYGTQLINTAVEAPTDKLQNVREATKRIERGQDQRVNEADKAGDTEHQ